MARPNNLRGGRPRRHDGLLEHVVSVRLTASQMVRVDLAAEAAGKPVAEWIRDVALEAAPSILPAGR